MSQPAFAPFPGASSLTPRPFQAGPAPASTPALLTMAGYGGTLAAVRCLGRAGVPVTVALGAPGQPAAWSRWTTRRVWCPGPPDSERFMDRLLRFGEDEPGHVLYPTCDDLAYAFARRREEVRKSFLTYQPPAPVLLGLLDKKSLLFAARSAGIGSARTWFPDGDGGLRRIAREARFPLLIKPRTQLLWPSLHKGTRVDRREDLIRGYTEYRRLRSHAPALLAERPDAAWPMLQEYHVEAEERLESVAGFIDASGEVFVARAATKVLQYPRRVGIGVCFEDAPLDPDAARGIAALCRNSGYFGVFEAEFIRSGERRLLIDFNPRYYNQMGFEIARGLPLPLLVHAAACRDDERLRALARDAQRPHTERARAYCHRFLLALILGGQRLSGRMASGDTERWRAWQARHRSQLVDGAFDPEDKTPGLLAAAWQLWPALRRPRAFFRSIALNE